MLGNDTVTLYDGSSVPVSALSAGQYVLGYSIATNSTQALRVSLVTESHASAIEYINGNIGVTPLDQPMYVRNDTYTGWIDNPSTIRTGWYLFQPATKSWVEVYSITYGTGDFAVYNVYTNSTNTYVVNGVLVDMKA